MINTKKNFKSQMQQYSEVLTINDTVPAGQTKLAKRTISSIGHFRILEIRGVFETLEEISDGGGGLVTVDTGIDYLSAVIRDGSGNRALFSDFTPLSLFLSPGRVRSADANATNNLIDQAYALRADKSNNLFYPFEFPYTLSANTDLLLEVKNTSNVELDYTISFKGRRLLTANAVKGAIQR